MSSPSAAAPSAAPDQLVRQLYVAYQARDWPGTQPLLHPDVTVDIPSMGQRLASRAELTAFNRDFPEPWGEMTVRRAIGNGADQAAAEIEVVEDGQLAWRMAAFWQLKEGQLWRGTEYWVQVRPAEASSGTAGD